MIVFRRPWETQPQEPLQLSSAYAPKFVWVGTSGRRLLGPGPLDATTFSGTSTATQAGLAMAHNGTSNHETWVINEPNSGYPILVGGSFVVTQTSTANQSAVGVGGTTLAGGMYLGVGQYTAGTVGSWGRVAISGADAAINGPTAVIGQRYNVVRVSRSATDHVMYVNGVRYSSSTNSSTANDSWKNFSIGTTVRDTTPVFYGRQSVHLGFFDRVDPGEEWMRAWSLNEWLLFEPLVQTIPLTVSVGGYTLTLEPATYAITGGDATLLADRFVSLATGSYSLTGSDATLIKALILDAGSSSYTLTGSDATLVRQALLDAGVGAYSVTGADATLTYTAAGAYSLNLESGGYSLTGSDVTFEYSGGSVTIKAGSWIRYRIIT